MLSNDTLTSCILDTFIGALFFFAAVAGATYYLQSSLILFKLYGSHAHWAAVLIGVPLTAGLVMRRLRLAYPLISCVVGAVASAALLYPFYKGFWAVPPTITDLVVYMAVVLGIGYIATQPLRTTFMIAFRLGRFSLPTLTSKSKKPVRKASMSKTQRLQASQHGNVIAMMELLIGLSSLALSIFSIFFLGRS